MDVRGTRGAAVDDSAEAESARVERETSEVEPLDPAAAQQRLERRGLEGRVAFESGRLTVVDDLLAVKGRMELCAGGVADAVNRPGAALGVE
jgi:hypothetical protein